MSFDPGAQLDPGQISDRRGMGGRTGVAVGGGGLGLVLLLAYTLLGGNPNDLGPLLEPGAVTGPESSAIATECKTGEDANERDDCRILGYVNSIQTYWTDEFAASGEHVRAGRHRALLGRDAERLRDRERRDRARSTARPTSWSTSTSGSSRSCARGSAHQAGSFAQGYVVAHEYGHHVQDLLGVLGSRQAQGEGAEGGSVRTELQADCLAGVWANHAEAGILAPLTDAQIADAPRRGRGGRRRPHPGSRQRAGRTRRSWTHGSSAQRAAVVHHRLPERRPRTPATRSPRPL